MVADWVEGTARMTTPDPHDTDGTGLATAPRGPPATDCPGHASTLPAVVACLGYAASADPSTAPLRTRGCRRSAFQGHRRARDDGRTGPGPRDGPAGIDPRREPPH